VAAFRSALQVLTEANVPSKWRQTMENLARTYELERDWSSARQSYEQLLRHDPGNIELQAKVKELTEKR
jgi:hypothetical protein